MAEGIHAITISTNEKWPEYTNGGGRYEEKDFENIMFFKEEDDKIRTTDIKIYGMERGFCYDTVGA